jgi:nucleoside-diphosphate-sugar epimerase
MSILVTGGSGAIGTKIIKRLSDLGEETISFQRSKPSEGYFPKTTKVVQGDVTHFEEVIACIKEFNVTKIIHLAFAMAPECEARPYHSTVINVLGGNNIFEAARLCGIERVVCASSLAYYGPQSNYGDNEVVEESFGPPTLVYGAHKQLGEYIARKYVDQHGLSIGVLRVGHVHSHFAEEKIP